MQHCSTTHNTVQRSALSLKKWDTHNRQHPWKPTTLQLWESPMEQYANANPRPWTCVSTGSKTASDWNKGGLNRGDYFTLHHPTSHHIKMRPIYLQRAANACTTGTARVCSSRSRGIPALLGRRLARHVAKHYASQRYAIGTPHNLV